VYDHDYVSRAADLVPGELSDRHGRHRECRMGTVERRHVEARNFGILQIFRTRLLRSVDQLLPVDDLQDAAFVGAVAEIDAIAGRPSRDRAMQFGRYGTDRTGLLACQSEITNFDGVRGIAQIIDLRHAARAPARRAGDKKRYSGIALPPAFM